ncbi:MAG TPA: Mur ligase family protein, partial [Candidatus Nitrosocosmicus sp.]|nr:Mur ligase family protein [Candidatus Nitrosocosmicus sp.]
MSNEIIEHIKQQYQNKKILVVGLGLQGGGVGVIKFFAELGAQVTVTDLKSSQQLQDSINLLHEYDITYRLGRHDIDDFINTDVIFKGPSVRWDIPELILARQKDIPIEMEASFFASHCPAKIIGITGTRGKSTTTQMIYEIIKNAGKTAYLGGNVRNISTISLLHTVNSNDIVILELSSWQLSGFREKKLSPGIGVFTNFYPDHLNYYKSMDEYWNDKAVIFQFQKPEDVLIANANLQDKIGQTLCQV